MKILITGATGLVGKSFGLALVKLGHEITVVSRNAISAQRQCPYPCKVIEADLNNSLLDNDKLNDIDAVINLMGEPIVSGRWTEAKKKSLFDSRVQATKNLRLSFKSKLPKIFISTSAIGIYGNRDNEVLTEESKIGAGFLAELCKAWEHEAHSFLSANTRVVILRLGIVISQEGGALVEMLRAFRAGVGGNLASGKQWMSWIHIDDLVAAYIFALRNGQVTGVINATAFKPVTNIEFTHTLSQLLHRPAIMPIPKVALNFILGEKASILTASQQVLPKKLESWGFTFKYAELQKALQSELSEISQGNELFVKRQYIDRPIVEVFAFFAEAKNLEKITPAFLNFKIISVSTKNIEQGTLIEYSLKIHGVPIKWKTQIESWHPPYEFVDNQLSGPYALWQHTHSFMTLGSGTLITDRVRYRLPLGYLGWLTSDWVVQKDIETIFAFRSRMIADNKIS